MNAKKSKQGKQKRIVSAVLLTTFAFVLACAAGFFPCPKIGFTNGEPELGASQEFVMPCHPDSQEEATSNGKSNGDSCQCDEISNSESFTFQIEFSKLVRVSLQKLYVLSHLDLPVLNFEWQKSLSLSESIPNKIQLQQKTIRLLI